MISDFGNILLFTLSGVVFIVVMLAIAKMLRPNRPNDQKLTTYESGEEPVGNANVAFNPRFYVVALIFVLFEVEIAFLFPWSVVFSDKKLIAETNGLWGWFTLTEMFIFVGLLVVGLAYAWAKGYLEWAKPTPKIPESNSTVPHDLYKKINEKY